MHRVWLRWAQLQRHQITFRNASTLLLQVYVIGIAYLHLTSDHWILLQVPSLALSCFLSVLHTYSYELLHFSNAAIYLHDSNDLNMESAGTTSNLARRFEALEQVCVSKSRWLVVCVSCKYREYINSTDLDAVQSFFFKFCCNSFVRNRI